MPVQELILTLFWCFASGFLARGITLKLPDQLEWLDDPDPSNTLFTSWSTEAGNRHWVFHLPYLGFIRDAFFAKESEPNYRWFFWDILSFVLMIGSVFLSRSIEMHIALCLLVPALIVISDLDLDHHWIPSVISTPLIWIGLAWSPFVHSTQERIYAAMLGGGLTVAVMMVISLIMQARSGEEDDYYAGGDVAMIVVMGAWLGFDALQNAVLASFVFMYVHSKIVRQSWIPLGPSLAAAFVLGIILVNFGVSLF